MIAALLAAGVDAVEPTHLKDFMSIAGWGLGVAALIWGFTRKTTTVAPDPLRVQKADAFASREFCAQIHGEVGRRLDGHDADIRALYGELKRDREANENHASARSSAIYAKIDAVQGEMQKGFRDVERSLGRLENAIKRD